MRSSALQVQTGGVANALKLHNLRTTQTTDVRHWVLMSLECFGDVVKANYFAQLKENYFFC